MTLIVKMFFLLLPFAKAAGEKLHLSPDDNHRQGNGGGGGGCGIEVAAGAAASKSQFELNDVSCSTGVTGSTTVTSRSSRSFDVSSSAVNPKSEAGLSTVELAPAAAAKQTAVAATVNGSLAPPQMI